jgi:hypothetical protein
MRGVNRFNQVALGVKSQFTDLAAYFYSPLFPSRWLVLQYGYNLLLSHFNLYVVLRDLDLILHQILHHTSSPQHQ